MKINLKFCTDSDEILIPGESQDGSLGSLIEETFSRERENLVILLGNEVIWKTTEKSDILIMDILKHGNELTIYRENSEVFKRFQKIHKNYVNSTNLCPQFFVKTSFIFLEVIVNERKLKALVDTGAQLSIISKSCAEKCGIFDQLDTRFAVDASGFIGGVRQALGKILYVDVNISGKSMRTILTVIDELNSEIILGIDFLKAYNATLDLKNGRIIFDEKVEAKFLNDDL